MTQLTLLVVATWVLALAVRNPLVAVAAGGMTPTGAFLVVGDIALPTVYASAIFAVAATAFLARHTGRTRRRTWGITVLWLFALWVTVVTVLAPFLFAGIRVLSLGGDSRLLGPEVFLTSSNIAQLLYLMLGVAVAAIAAAQPDRTVWLVFVTLTGAALLSLWRYLSLNAGLAFPAGFFDNSPGFRYIDTAPGGFVRFRGIFSEPAALAVSSLAGVGMGFALLPLVRGLRLLFVLLGIGAAVFNLSQSTSATGQVSIAVLAAAGVTAALIGFVLLGRRWSKVVIATWVVGALLAIWLVPIAIDAVAVIVGGKLGTSSYDERSSTDIYAYNLLLRTWGIGVGVGSIRPSSFLAALLASTGVIGALLFFGVVVAHLLRVLPFRRYRPLVWCLLAVLLAKLISSPDLSDTSGVMWLVIGGIFGAVAAGQPGAPAVAPVRSRFRQGRFGEGWRPRRPPDPVRPRGLAAQRTMPEP